MIKRLIFIILINGLLAVKSLAFDKGSQWNLLPDLAKVEGIEKKTSLLEKEPTSLYQDFWDDGKTTIKYLLKGSYLQFQQKSNLAYLGLAAASSWYAFKHDDRLTYLAMGKDAPGLYKVVSDSTLYLNFPIVPISLYFFGKRKENTKLMQFAMEYTAAFYLALFESGVLSFIPVHERPKKEQLNFWETAFRGNSSWPSGHIVAYSALFFKTLQFYGPLWAIIPGVLTAITGYQRVQAGKHFFSDVVGGFFLSAFASEGVRAAAQYKDNHPFYKWMVSHDLQVGVLAYKGVMGPRFSFNF